MTRPTVTPAGALDSLPRTVPPTVGGGTLCPECGERRAHRLALLCPSCFDAAVADAERFGELAR